MLRAAASVNPALCWPPVQVAALWHLGERKAAARERRAQALATAAEVEAKR